MENAEAESARRFFMAIKFPYGKSQKLPFELAHFFCALRSFSAAGAQMQQSEFFKKIFVRFAEKACYIRFQFAIC